MAKDKIVNIFWTAGWDSTYRVIELSFQQVTIQPVYCHNSKRRSSSIELQHIKDMVKIIENKPKTKAKFLPIEIVDISALPQDSTIENAYKEFIKEIPLGKQYVFLAKVAQKFPGIELGVERQDTGKGHISSSFERFAKLIKKDNIYYLDPKGTKDFCYTIFGQMSYPIYDISEVEMFENIKKWGYEDVMKHIWFCHTPLKEQGEWCPCGTCWPCIEKMENNMEFLLPPKAQKRYRLGQKLAKYINRNRASFLIHLLNFYKVKDFIAKEK